MVNERRPSREKKGRHHLPKTLPGTLCFAPRPLNIRKSSMNYESGGDSSDGDDIRPDYEDIDEEGVSRTELAKAMAGDQIIDHGAAIHSTLGKLPSGANYSGSEREIPENLLTSKWTTPPTSPTVSLSPLLRVSPQFKAHRVKYLERTIKNLDVGQLMKHDKKFHNLMWELDGIREWWTANRKEWIKNRNRLHTSQMTLNSLVTQMKAAGSSKLWDQHLRLQDACVQQRKHVQRNENCQYAFVTVLYSDPDDIIPYYVLVHGRANISPPLGFPENKYLMNLVMVQFKRIQRKSRELDVILSHRVVASKWVAPDGFSFGTFPPDQMAMYRTQWWPRQGLRWWFVMAAGHLENCVEDRTLQRDPEKEAYESVKDEIKQLEASLAILEADAQYDSDYARTVDDSMQTLGDPSSIDWKNQLRDLGRIVDPKALLRRKEIVATQAALKQLALDRHSLGFSVYRATTLIERDSAILDLVQNVLKATDNNRESLLLSSMDFAGGLYYVCSVQGLSEGILSDIEDISFDDLLQDEDKLAVMRSFELQLDAKESRRCNELLVKTLNNAIPFQSDLKDAKDCILYQFNVLNRTLDLAQSLQHERTVEGNLPLHTYPGHDSGLSTTPNPPLPSQNFNWGQVKTLEQARKILSRGAQDPYQDPGWFLRNFFVSPDVAPHFKRIEKITKDTFFELANSFVQIDFFVDEIDAFLLWCTVVGDLFTMSGNFVSAYKCGWERIDEMPIDTNCPRASELRKPPGLDDLKSWLVRNQEKFDLVSAERDTTESQLMSMIQTNYPRGEYVFTFNKLRAILSWLDKTGLLYRYTSRKNRRGEPIIRRIDSGWGPIDRGKPYDAIFDLDRPEPYFQQLRSIINRGDVQTVLREANEAGPIGIEWSLYNILQPYLQVKRLSGMSNTIITRHRFHLYLRWCDQIGDGMDFRRDGRVFGGPKL